VQLIEDLEGSLHTSKPFYPSRPEHSTVAVNHFLANLEGMFTEELAASNGGL
jgi:hypothetical protein